MERERERERGRDKKGERRINSRFFAFVAVLIFGVMVVVNSSLGLRRLDLLVGFGFAFARDGIVVIVVVILPLSALRSAQVAVAFVERSPAHGRVLLTAALEIRFLSRAEIFDVH